MKDILAALLSAIAFVCAPLLKLFIPARKTQSDLDVRLNRFGLDKITIIDGPLLPGRFQLLRYNDNLIIQVCFPAGCCVRFIYDLDGKQLDTKLFGYYNANGIQS